MNTYEIVNEKIISLLEYGSYTVAQAVGFNRITAQSDKQEAIPWCERFSAFGIEIRFTFLADASTG